MLRVPFPATVPMAVSARASRLRSTVKPAKLNPEAVAQRKRTAGPSAAAKNSTNVTGSGLRALLTVKRLNAVGLLVMLRLLASANGSGGCP